ncbi:unnamed protein product [Bathycoccus prasinos]
MVVEEQGGQASLFLPANNLLLETIHDHFWMPVGAEGKPRGWKRIGQGSGRGRPRLRYWFGSKKNYRSGQISITFLRSI